MYEPTRTDEDFHLSWDCLTHPDQEALAKRDAFLAPKENICNIEFLDGEIHADVKLEEE